ncbi:MAG: hypothetical protein M5U26_30160 [Planctomycetota bacterium]|nr:hypothetical protein [Planctomycetota bacterium]
MEPTPATQWEVQFAAPLSPWWLLALLPLAGWLAWRLYRAQARAVEPPHGRLLGALRAALLLAVVALAFRPSLIRRTVLDYPGRVVVVVDDSESMTARDTSDPDSTALFRYRRVFGAGEEQQEAFHRLAESLARAEALLRRFERFARRTARTEEAYWDEQGRVQDLLAQVFKPFDADAGALPKLPEDAPRAEPALAAARERRAELEAILSAEAFPGPQACEALYGELAGLRGTFLELQARLDAAALARGDAPSTEALRRMRNGTRLELLAAQFKRLEPEWEEGLPGQRIEFVRAMSGQALERVEAGREALKPAPGPTDLLGRLEAIVGQESAHPLSAVLLVSDGRDHSGRSLPDLARAFARRQAPIMAAGVGAVEEPLDLAVLDVVAPPFAVQGVPFTVRARLKTVLSGPQRLKVEVVESGRALASEELDLGDAPEARVALKVTLPAAGLFRCELRIAPAEGEIVPERNNRAEFAVHARADRTKVLFLDWKPRWETRFALNVFQRLDYIDLNAIVVAVQEDGTLKRGVERGTWPATPEALKMYDLVVLGDLPGGVLTEAEWGALRALVEEQGRTLCLIGSGRADPLPDNEALRGALLPLVPREEGARASAAELDAPARLALTEAGRLHPLTRRLAGVLETAPPGAMPRLRPDTVPLLLERETLRPLVCCRDAGKGKTLLIDTPDLWKALNPTQLEAHMDLYLEQLTWAVEGGLRTGEESYAGPRLGLDRRREGGGRALQVWARDARPGEEVEALDGENVVATQPLETLREGSPLSRAVFDSLPAGAFVFRLKREPRARTESLIRLEEDVELKRLARDEAVLEALAKGTGGARAEAADLEYLLARVEPKRRIEKHESVWRLWESGLVLGLLVCALALEWVWRKLVGLV